MSPLQSCHYGRSAAQQAGVWHQRSQTFHCLLIVSSQQQLKRKKTEKGKEKKITIKEKKNMMKFADIVSDPLFRLDVSSVAAAARDSLRGNA